MTSYKEIIKAILLFFIFILLTGPIFWSMKLSLDNSGRFLYEGAKASFYDSLQYDSLQNEEKVINQKSEGFSVNAESFISVKVRPDYFSQILLSKNDKKRLPIASLVKLMTALVVLENYNLPQKVKVSELAMAQEGEQGNLKQGEILSVKNLLYISLIESSNKAAFALSEVIGTDKFIALMNETSQKIGLSNTHFKDATGLDQKSYSTSEDIAKLSGYLFENYQLFREIINLKEFDLYLDNGEFHHKLINTNKLLGENLGIVGGKTGWTSFSRGCFMVIQKNPESDNYLIHVILGSEDRTEEIKKIINWINKEYQI